MQIFAAATLPWRIMMFKPTQIATIGAIAFVLSAPVVATAAGTAAGNFNVNVTLTSKCEINTANGATGAAIDALAMSYTSFQTAASTASTNFAVRCTDGLGYALALDTASVTNAANGLQYTLNLSANSAHSATANASLTGQTGTGLTAKTFYVHGNMAAGQDGSMTAGTGNNTRSVTITY